MNSLDWCHHKATKQKVLVGMWRVIESTRLQNLAVRSIIVFSSTPSGNKLQVVGIHNRMGKPRQHPGMLFNVKGLLGGVLAGRVAVESGRKRRKVQVSRIMANLPDPH
eukprot:354618-Pelagomonas_calceolata.AAC.3